MSKDRIPVKGSKAGYDDTVFKSPRSWASQGSLINIDLTENKRSRTDTKHSDTDSYATGTSKKYRMATDRTLRPEDLDQELAENEWQDAGSMKNSNNRKKKNETEILETLEAMRVTLNKVKCAGKKLSKYFADVPVNSRATGKMLAGNVERYAAMAMEYHRKIELIREIEQLRYRDLCTQVTPGKTSKEIIRPTAGTSKKVNEIDSGCNTNQSDKVTSDVISIPGEGKDTGK